MVMPPATTKDDPELRERYRQFAEQSAVAAERESVRARALEWRGVSFEKRAWTGIGLMRLSAIAVASRSRPYVKGPLKRIEPVVKR